MTKSGTILIGFLIEVALFMSAGAFFLIASINKKEITLLFAILLLGLSLYTAMIVGEWIGKRAIEQYEEQQIKIKKSIKRTLKDIRG